MLGARTQSTFPQARKSIQKIERQKHRIDELNQEILDYEIKKLEMVGCVSEREKALEEEKSKLSKYAKKLCADISVHAEKESSSTEHATNMSILAKQWETEATGAVKAKEELEKKLELLKASLLAQQGVQQNQQQLNMQTPSKGMARLLVIPPSSHLERWELQ